MLSHTSSGLASHTFAVPVDRAREFAEENIVSDEYDDDAKRNEDDAARSKRRQSSSALNTVPASPVVRRTTSADDASARRQSVVRMTDGEQHQDTRETGFAAIHRRIPGCRMATVSASMAKNISREHAVTSTRRTPEVRTVCTDLISTVNAASENDKSPYDVRAANDASVTASVYGSFTGQLRHKEAELDGNVRKDCGELNPSRSPTSCSSYSSISTVERRLSSESSGFGSPSSPGPNATASPTTAMSSFQRAPLASATSGDNRRWCSPHRGDSESDNVDDDDDRVSGVCRVSTKTSEVVAAGGDVSKATAQFKQTATFVRRDLYRKTHRQRTREPAAANKRSSLSAASWHATFRYVIFDLPHM
jgi:hypothetical protein